VQGRTTSTPAEILNDKNEVLARSRGIFIAIDPEKCSRNMLRGELPEEKPSVSLLGPQDQRPWKCRVTSVETSIGLPSQRGALNLQVFKILIASFIQNRCVRNGQCLPREFPLVLADSAVQHHVGLLISVPRFGLGHELAIGSAVRGNTRGPRWHRRVE